MGGQVFFLSCRMAVNFAILGEKNVTIIIRKKYILELIKVMMMSEIMDLKMEN